MTHLIRPAIAASLILTSGIGLSSLAPLASAATKTEGTTVSARTFTPPSMKRTLLKESVSTNTTGNWEGVEQLSIPQTAPQANATTQPQEQDQPGQAESEAQSTPQASRSDQRDTTAETDKQQNKQTTPTADPTVQRNDTTNTTTDENTPSAASLTDPTPSSSVISEASKYLGTPYVYGGTTPAGFDCSGFTQYVYGQLGIQLPRTDSQQLAWALQHGTEVSLENAQPGDLMWKSGHVGIYAGNGQMIHSPKPGESVRYQSVYATFRYFHIAN